MSDEENPAAEAFKPANEELPSDDGLHPGDHHVSDADVSPPVQVEIAVESEINDSVISVMEDLDELYVPFVTDENTEPVGDRFSRSADTAIVCFNKKLDNVHQDLLNYGELKANELSDRLTELIGILKKSDDVTQAKLDTTNRLLNLFAEHFKQIVLHHNPASYFADTGSSVPDLVKELVKVIELIEVLPETTHEEEEEEDVETEGVMSEREMLRDRAMIWIEYILLELGGKGNFEGSEELFTRMKTVVKTVGTPKQDRLVGHLIHAIQGEIAQSESQFTFSVRSSRQ